MAKGYEVLAAPNGEEALSKVKEYRPHLILLEARMPEMSGLEVLKQVREIDREVGVIMVTGVNEGGTGWQALRMGAFDYITKPLDLDYLERSLWYKITTMTLMTLCLRSAGGHPPSEAKIESPRKKLWA